MDILHQKSWNLEYNRAPESSYKVSKGVNELLIVFEKWEKTGVNIKKTPWSAQRTLAQLSVQRALENDTILVSNKFYSLIFFFFTSNVDCSEWIGLG